VLRAPGMLALHLSLEAAEWPVKVRVWDDVVEAWDMGDIAAQWFSDFLGTDAPADLKRLRLVRFDPEVRRLCSRKWTGGRESTTQFADGFGVLVTSTASMDGLNDAPGSRPARRRWTSGAFGPTSCWLAWRRTTRTASAPGASTPADGAGRAGKRQTLRALPDPNIDPDTAIPSPAVGDALAGLPPGSAPERRPDLRHERHRAEGDGLILKVGQAVSADWSTPFRCPPERNPP
jgi:uncharacterized protein